MKKLKVSVGIVTLSLLSSVFASSGSEITDNNIRLYTGKGVAEISYNLTSTESATSSSDEALAANEFVNDYLNIDFQAISAGSDSLLQEFQNSLYLPSQTYAVNAESVDSPSALNFILTGDLTINGSTVTYPVKIAKENDGNHHGIWIGSYNSWKDNSSDFLWVKTEDGHQYCISNGDGGEAKDYSFMISSECPAADTSPINNTIQFSIGDGVKELSYNLFFGMTQAPIGQPYSEILNNYWISYSSKGDELVNLSFHAGNEDLNDNQYLSQGHPSISSLDEYESNINQQYDDTGQYSYYNDKRYFLYQGMLFINGQGFYINIQKNISNVKDAANNSLEEWILQSTDQNASVFNDSIALKAQDGNIYCLKPSYQEEDGSIMNGFDHRFTVEKCG